MAHLLEVNNLEVKFGLRFGDLTAINGISFTLDKGERMGLVGEIVQIYDNYCIETEVIVASIRHPFHFVQSALMGADVATIPFSTLSKLLNHPLTDIGMEKFLKDWEKVSK